MYKNKLYFGDNLEVMQEMEDECIDLICTDPPFNSGRNYNIFLNSKAQKKAFSDIWEWNEASEEMRSNIRQLAKTNNVYWALNEVLIGYDYILQQKRSGWRGAMRSYLTFMGPRLAEMHRLLRNTGSIYLHCDPSASHYLKGIMDAVFENENFRNEIIWRIGWVSGYKTKKRGWIRNHDTIFYYLKTPEAQKLFNKEYIPYKKDHVRRDGSKPTGKGIAIEDTWNCSSGDRLDSIMIKSFSSEKLGYPTQKPRELYERMIKASSNPDDLVFDPFAGCGTTIDAAESLERRWIGIDITLLALEPMQQRLLERHGLRSNIDYKIEGYPTNMEEVYLLVNDQKRYHDFSNWAVTRLGLQPTKDVGDGGFDGVSNFTTWIPEGMKENEGIVMAEVKSGKLSPHQVRAFCDSINDNNAIAGIFITLQKPTAKMRERADRMGTFEHNGVEYPRLQFWQITDEYFNNPDSINRIVRLPKSIKSSKKSERHVSNKHQYTLDVAAG